MSAAYTAVVTGASGFIATELVKQLLEKVSTHAHFSMWVRLNSQANHAKWQSFMHVLLSGTVVELLLRT
jgi:nucleoside-diphosphate-sugar epimerase